MFLIKLTLMQVGFLETVNISIFLSVNQPNIHTEKVGQFNRKLLETMLIPKAKHQSRWHSAQLKTFCLYAPIVPVLVWPVTLSLLESLSRTFVKSLDSVKCNANAIQKIGPLSLSSESGSGDDKDPAIMQAYNEVRSFLWEQYPSPPVCSNSIMSIPEVQLIRRDKRTYFKIQPRFRGETESRPAGVC